MAETPLIGRKHEAIDQCNNTFDEIYSLAATQYCTVIASAFKTTWTRGLLVGLAWI